jgi:creatinine amidohydrolase
MSKVYQLGHMKRQEVAAIAAEAIALVPIGATEQHGEHLPLLTDTIIVDGITRRALDMIETRSPVVVTPVLPIGSSHHHLFACAISLSNTTLIAVLRDICTSLIRSGFRKIFFVNGHGGNDLAMRLVCSDLVLEQDIAVAACSYWTLTSPTGRPAESIDHAGAYETSYVKYLAPELVGTPGAGLGDRKAFFDTVLSQGLLVNRHGEWSRIGGVTTRADGSSAERGQRNVEDRAAALADAIRRFDELTLDEEYRS